MRTGATVGGGRLVGPDCGAERGLVVPATRFESAKFLGQIFHPNRPISSHTTSNVGMRNLQDGTKWITGYTMSTHIHATVTPAHIGVLSIHKRASAMTAAKHARAIASLSLGVQRWASMSLILPLRALPQQEIFVIHFRHPQGGNRHGRQGNRLRPAGATQG